MGGTSALHPEAGVQINCLHLSATAGLVGAFKGMRGLKNARSAGCTMVHRADARVGAHDDVLGSMAAEGLARIVRCEQGCATAQTKV